MTNHITAPLREYGNFGGRVAVAALAFGALLSLGVYGYGIPMAAEQGALLDVFAAHGLAIVFQAVPYGIGIAALLTCIRSHRVADNADRNTERDDSASYYYHPDMKENRGTLTLFSDCGYDGKGPGVYVLKGSRYHKVRDFTPGELEERHVQNNGGFSGYNEAINHQ